MSFLAKLVLGSNEYPILNVDYEISQPIGKRNMPTDAPHVGLINLVVESSNKEELLSWAASPKLTKNGSVIFYRRDAQSSMKTLNFKDTFCISYKETFEADGSVPMKVLLTLAARSIDCQGVMLEEQWPGFGDSSSGGGSESSSGNQNSDSGEITSFIP